MSSYSRIQLENWLKTLEVKGNVLDIGSGQLGVKKRLKSCEGEVIGSDLENPHQGNKQNIIIDLNYPIEFI